LDVLAETPDEDAVETADQYALSVAERMREAFKFMREFSSKQTERMRSNYDASIKTKSFEPGSYVLLYVPKVPKGTYSKWAIFYQGPYVVSKTPKLKDLVVHCDRMRPYFAGLDGTPWQKYEQAKVLSENRDHMNTDTVDNSDSTSMHIHEEVVASTNGHEGGQQPITEAAKLSCLRRNARRPSRYCQQVGVWRVLCVSHVCEEDSRHCCPSELSNYWSSKTFVDVENSSIAPRGTVIDCRRDRGGSNCRRREMSGHNGASDSSSGDDIRHDGRNGRYERVDDLAGPSGPPRRRGRGPGCCQDVTESASQEDSTRGTDRYHIQDDRYLARGRDQPVVMLHDARHLLDDAGTASAYAGTSSDNRYRQHACGTAGTSSATDRYQSDARGDRHRDRGDADRYSPGTGRAPPLREQRPNGADRHSPGDDRVPPTDKPEVDNQKRRCRRRGGRAFSPRPCRRCGGSSVFKSSSGLRPHEATEHHMYFRHPDAYIPIPPDQLDVVLRSICQGQVHRRPKKSAGKKKKAQVRQVILSVHSPSPAWDLGDTRASPPAAAASAAAGRPPTPSYALQEDGGVFLAGQGEDLELPEIFQSG